MKCGANLTWFFAVVPIGALRHLERLLGPCATVCWWEAPLCSLRDQRVDGPSSLRPFCLKRCEGSPKDLPESLVADELVLDDLAVAAADSLGPVADASTEKLMSKCILTLSQLDRRL